MLASLSNWVGVTNQLTCCPQRVELCETGSKTKKSLLTIKLPASTTAQVGVVDIKPEDIKEKGRLRPGNIFYVDLKNGRVLPDMEMKQEICGKRRYRQWIDRQKV